MFIFPVRIIFICNLSLNYSDLFVCLPVSPSNRPSISLACCPTSLSQFVYAHLSCLSLQIPYPVPAASKSKLEKKNALSCPQLPKRKHNDKSAPTDESLFFLLKLRDLATNKLSNIIFWKHQFWKGRNVQIYLFSDKAGINQDLYSVSVSVSASLFLSLPLSLSALSLSLSLSLSPPIRSLPLSLSFSLYSLCFYVLSISVHL